jgi:DNA end-binding protein Ku
MSEAVWKGFLRLSLLSCPVHLRAAVRDATTPRFELLNGRTGNPLVTQFVDASTGEIVAADAVVHGYRVGSGRPVVLSADEIEGLHQAPPDIIEVAEFLARDAFDRTRIETSYFVCPEGQLAADTLEALRLAMQRRGCEALAYIRLDGRERTVLIELHGAGLMLSTLRPPRLPEPPAFVERTESAVPAEMIEIAESIISRRLFAGDPATAGDRYEARLRALIEQKAAAAPPQPPTPAPVAPLEPSAGADLRADVPEPVPEGALAVAAAAVPDAAEGLPRRELGAEILLHISGVGDRRFAEAGWAGQPGSRQAIEAISIRPRDELEPNAVEFRVFAREGRATAWVSNGNYAGTRGRDLPLTGFAVRAAPELRERLDVVYEGCFFDAGVVGPARNGEVCVSPTADDPLEAIRVSIVDRPPPAVS